MFSFLTSLRRWFRVRAFPGDLVARGGPGLIDSYRRHRAPTPAELLTELKGTAWTCASLNASVAASFPPRLFVTTRAGESQPKCLTKSLSAPVHQRLRAAAHL